MKGKDTESKDRKRVWLAVALLLPAGLFLLANLVVPALGTVVAGFTDWSTINWEDVEFIGLDNYAEVLDDPAFGSSLRLTAAMVFARLLAVLLAPLVPAVVAARLGRRLRLWMRLLFSAPLAAFAPAAAAVTWVMTFSPEIGLVKPVEVDSDLMRTLYLILDGLATFGLASGLAMIFCPAALRGMEGKGPRPWRQVWRPLPLFWIVGGIAVLALTPQSLLGSYFLGGGGDPDLTTLGLYHHGALYEPTFGLSTAIATPVLIVLVLLGLAVGRFITGLRPRLDVAPPEEGAVETAGGAQPGRGRGWLAALALLAGVVICVSVVLPWLWTGLTSIKSEADLRAGVFFPSPPSWEAYTVYLDQLPVGRALLNTYVLPLVGILLVVIPVAYAAAFSIGLLRPLGERSDRLLALFSPWLFVTIGPLLLPSFALWGRLGFLNTTSALFPPITLSVAALFVLWAFFRGREPAWRAAREAGTPAWQAFFRQVFLPSLPLALLLAAAALLVSAAEWAWRLLALSSEKITATLMLTGQLTGVVRSGMPPSAVAAVLVALFVPAALLLYIAFAVAQVRYLDRLVLEVDVAAQENA